MIFCCVFWGPYSPFIPKKSVSLVPQIFQILEAFASNTTPLAKPYG